MKQNRKTSIIGAIITAIKRLDSSFKIAKNFFTADFK